jgi:hypothetical protein
VPKLRRTLRSLPIVEFQHAAEPFAARYSIDISRLAQLIAVVNGQILASARHDGRARNRASVAGKRVRLPKSPDFRSRSMGAAKA